MSNTVRIYGTPALRFWMLVAFLALLILAACGRRQKALTESTAQSTFASPEDAGAALRAAARSGDEKRLLAIFGADSKEALFTGSAAADGTRLQDFVKAYGQMHRWARIKAGGQVLQVGADNYPFPIPLGQNSSGRWYFDTAAGKDEILARRIGKNELTAMEASEAIANAEQQYCRKTHDSDRVKQYAQKFVSDPGKHNGLYWPVADGQPASPLGRLGDFTTALSAMDESGKPLLFNGYCYRILTRGGTPKDGNDHIGNGKMTGGFAILAYPAEYRKSGIMSIMVGENGMVYQKDLGEKTADLAAAMTEANPGDGWNSTATQTNTATHTEQ